MKTFEVGELNDHVEEYNHPWWVMSIMRLVRKMIAGASTLVSSNK